MCVGICPKWRDSNGNPIKKRGGGSRKRPSEVGHLVLPTPAGSLPPGENYPRDTAKSVFRGGTERLGSWLRPAMWPTWRAVPRWHEHEDSPTGPGTPSPARWGLRFLLGQRGPRAPRNRGSPSMRGNPAGPFCPYCGHERKEVQPAEAGLGGGGSRQPAVCPHQHPSAPISTRASGPSWSQRTSSHSSEGHGNPDHSPPPTQTSLILSSPLGPPPHPPHPGPPHPQPPAHSASLFLSTLCAQALGSPRGLPFSWRQGWGGFSAPPACPRAQRSRVVQAPAGPGPLPIEAGSGNCRGTASLLRPEPSIPSPDLAEFAEALRPAWNPSPDLSC